MGRVFVCDSTHTECSAPGGNGCGYCIGVPCAWPKRSGEHVSTMDTDEPQPLPVAERTWTVTLMASVVVEAANASAAMSLAERLIPPQVFIFDANARRADRPQQP